ncbi:hypothetical protein A2U01_0071035, partial [Trifolium medium]|nr:hypothetical protein [Trifolium medium]
MTVSRNVIVDEGKSWDWISSSSSSKPVISSMADEDSDNDYNVDPDVETS